jgi:hypothetical protein
MNAYPEWQSMKEIDHILASGKGAAFRGFKRLLPGLEQGRDYLVLDASTDAADILALKQAGRIYSSSVQVVLLSAAAATFIRTALADPIR